MSVDRISWVSQCQHRKASELKAQLVDVGFAHTEELNKERRQQQDCDPPSLLAPIALPYVAAALKPPVGRISGRRLTS